MYRNYFKLIGALSIVGYLVGCLICLSFNPIEWYTGYRITLGTLLGGATFVHFISEVEL